MATTISPQRSTNRALRRFGFRQTIRGAVIIGLIAGIVMGAQGPAYNEAYPSATARQAFVKTLEAAPALGFMAGETANAAEPASYSIYKSITLMTMVTAIWGLLVTTRLLRGQEEDGRLEAILSGNTTKRRASTQLLLGLSGSVIISFALAFVGLASLGQLPNIGLLPGNAALLMLGVYLPGVVFAALGIFTSQLARTRGRAIMYGLVPLLLLFVVRGAGNSNPDLNWLKHLTPFGWTDLLNPVLGPHAAWLLPPMLCSVLFIGFGIFLAERRDMGASLLRESDVARSHFSLLGSPLTLAVRQQSWTFGWWTIGTLAFTGLIVGLAKLSVDILKDASGAQKIIGQLGHSSDDMAIAFIGIGNLIVVMILLVMVTLLLASIRRDEAKGYLDNLLVQPVARSRWLAGRLTLVVIVVAFIAFAAAFLAWGIARVEGIDVLTLRTLLLGAFNPIAVVLTVLGIGALIYGLWPRIAVVGMGIVIAWSYMLDIFKALVTLPSFVEKTSLFHYVSTSPVKDPDWSTIVWLVVIGGILACLGVIGFTKRDIASE